MTPSHILAAESGPTQPQMAVEPGLHNVMEQQRTQLVRGLTLTDTTALVVGTVIGTGVFIKSAIMAQDAGSPLLVLAAWVAAGLLSLAGALTYAELGAMLPRPAGSTSTCAAPTASWPRFSSDG